MLENLTLENIMQWLNAISESSYYGFYKGNIPKQFSDTLYQLGLIAWRIDSLDEDTGYYSGSNEFFDLTELGKKWLSVLTCKTILNYHLSN